VAERPNPYRGHRFPREVIAHAVRLYLRFALSFRDVEELLAERGIDALSRVGNLFRPRRHLLTAAAYRATLHERVVIWREIAGLRAA